VCVKVCEGERCRKRGEVEIDSVRVWEGEREKEMEGG
jgi:hypothetical protein